MKKETLKTIGLVVLFVVVIILLLANTRSEIWIMACEERQGTFLQLMETCWYETEHNESWIGSYYCDENILYFFNYSNSTP